MEAVVRVRMVIPAQPAVTAARDLSRRQTIVLVTLATLIGAAFRFYNLAWGAPYHHFHIDEHVVFSYANALARDSREAAQMSKFFMYSPFPMYILNTLAAAFNVFVHRLDLTVPRDEVMYMTLGRAISATLGTATIPLVYLVARRVSGRLAGVLASLFLACTVIHLRESHFFSLDVSMTFFTVIGLYFLVRIVERPNVRCEAGAAVALGLGIASKYSAAFLAPLIGLAELLSPAGPRTIEPFRLAPWIRAALRAAVTVAAGIAIFLVLDSLVLRYYDKFRSDIKQWVTDPLSGATKPEWIAQFADIDAVPYWFTNLLWWSLGPALEIWALAGVLWLFIRRDRVAIMAALFPVVYALMAGKTATIAPFIRYVVPLAPPLAIAAGALSADLLRSTRWRVVGLAATAVVVATTAIWALAYMNIFRQPDSRLAASQWLLQNVPRDSAILVEPSHNTPPMGSYLSDVDFHKDYVVWGPPRGPGERHDYYHLYTFDVYRTLYNPWSDENRRRYIESRLALGEWIVMDDTFLQQYQHLPESTHAVVKQHYRDLFASRLGFKLVKTFKVYPSLFGWTINDDDAELTFRSFDHPRIFIFRRQ